MLHKLPIIFLACGVILLCLCFGLANQYSSSVRFTDAAAPQQARAAGFDATRSSTAAAPQPARSAVVDAVPSSTAAAAAAGDPTCHTAEHTGYSGDRAVVWGLGKPGFHLKDAAECCKACQAHAATCSQKGAHAKSWWPSRPEMTCGGNPPCNVWTFCPVERCFAFDIHKCASPRSRPPPNPPAPTVPDPSHCLVPSPCCAGTNLVNAGSNIRPSTLHKRRTHTKGIRSTLTRCASQPARSGRGRSQRISGRAQCPSTYHGRRACLRLLRL